jgi:hypothetical protein
MFRFTLRDVLWLLALLGLAFDWHCGAREWRSERRELKARLSGQTRQVKCKHNQLAMYRLMLDSARSEQDRLKIPFAATDPVRRW